MGFLKEKTQAQPMSYDMGGMMNDAGVSDGSGNFIAQMADTAPENNMPMTVATEPKRQRVSALDIIGSILDTGAEFGGSTAGYQPTVDRRRTLEQEAQDRNFQQQFNQQRLTAGQLGIDGTKEEMGNTRADRQLTRFGQASRGLGAVFAKHGAPGVQKAFPLLAKSMGMNPQETEILGAALAADPEGTIETITAATTADNAGSQPKEKIISELLRQRDPTGALEKQYLDNLASGLSGFQEGQLGLGSDKITSAERIARIRADATVRAARIRAESSGNNPDAKAQAATASRATAAAGAITSLDAMLDAVERLNKAGSMYNKEQSGIGRVGAALNQNVPFLQALTNPDANSAYSDLEALRSQMVTSLPQIISGMSLGSRSFDAAAELKFWTNAFGSMNDYPSAVATLARLKKRAQEISNLPSSEPAAPAAPAAAPGGSTRQRIILKPRGNAAPSKGLGPMWNPKTGRFE